MKRIIFLLCLDLFVFATSGAETLKQIATVSLPGVTGRFDHFAEASEAFAGQWLGMENDGHASRPNTRKRDTPPSG